MHIDGKCHCGNIRLQLDWPGEASSIALRACGCDFCQKHGASWISHRAAELAVTIADRSLLSPYRFGTATAEFYVCARCGAVPVAVSTIDGHAYAVVNANTLEGIERNALARAATDFDGEATGERLERRKRSWIPAVRIAFG